MPFVKQAEFQTDFNGIPVTKWISSASGLSLVVANVESPLVNGYFALATEAMDDDGWYSFTRLDECLPLIPHTLSLGLSVSRLWTLRSITSPPIPPQTI